MLLPLVTMALVTPELLKSPDQSGWMKDALGSAFPFDGARYPGGGVHDPSIVRFGNTYVMVKTSGNEFCPVSTSSDLKEWVENGPILKKRPDWLSTAIPRHSSIWAPAPVKVGKDLRVYYCASARFGQNTSYIGYAECKDFDPLKPTSGWVDKGKLVESDSGSSNFNAIDPDVLTGPDGRQWMVYGSYWSGIYQVEIDPANGGIKNPGEAHRHVASNNESGNPLEAPVMFFKNGYYYLGVTYGLAAQGIRSTYRMMVGRSKEPTGPFLGFDGKPMTEGGHTILLKGSSPMFAPGGGNYFVGDDGELWMAYHFYDGREYWTDDKWGAPTLQIRKVMWGNDGWPLPGLPAGLELIDSGGDLTGFWKVQVDFGRVRDLEVKKDGSLRLDRQVGSWKVEGKTLSFTWPDENAPSGTWTDTLTLDPTRQYAVGRNQSGVVIRAIKANVQAKGTN